jgi:hypothetical protein
MEKTFFLKVEKRLNNLLKNAANLSLTYRFSLVSQSLIKLK